MDAVFWSCCFLDALCRLTIVNMLISVVMVRMTLAIGNWRGEACGVVKMT